jgi:hypothetical protein
MNILLCIMISMIFSSCGCANKEKILKERAESIAVVRLDHGDIIPPLVMNAPDLSECTM